MVPAPDSRRRGLTISDTHGHHAAEDARDVRSLVSGSARPSAYLTLLRNRNYRLWFTSGLISSLGDWAGLVALQTLVLILAEDSPQAERFQLFALGGIMMARLLPSLLVGPVVGVLADRYDRKRLMVFTDLVRGGLFVLIALTTDFVALFTLTFIVECLALLFLSSKDAVLPVFVRKEHLTEANQLNLLITYGTLPLGTLLATALVALAGFLRNAGLTTLEPTVFVLLLDAGTFLVAAALVSRLRIPPHGRRAGEHESQGIMTELREGLRFIRDLPLIRALILGVVGVAFGAAVVITLGPAFVENTLDRPETDWFTLMTFVGVGLGTGILSVPLLTRRFAKEHIFPIGLIATAALAVIIATLSNFYVALVIGFLLGGVSGLSFVLGYTLLHEHTRDDTRARTFAAFYTGTRIAMFAGLALAPFFAATIGFATLIVGGEVVSASGVRITIILGGLVGLVSAAIAGRAMLRASSVRPAWPTAHDAARTQHPDGLFIAFEGVEGSGKSTQVRALVETLTAEGHDIVTTREPGGPPVAERIRQIVLDPGDMDPRTEALLYAAARAEHVRRVIRPALEAGKVVVCDRYLDSSLAYQGHGRELGEEEVADVNRWATDGLMPDVVVLLHLDPAEGLRRAGERSRNIVRGRRRLRRAEAAESDGGEPVTGDRLERESLDFHRKVGAGYLALANQRRDRFIVVDASADTQTVARQVRSGLDAWLPLPVGRESQPQEAVRE